MSRFGFHAGIAWLGAALIVSSGCGGVKEESILMVPTRARYADEIVVSPEFAKCKLEEKVAKVVRRAARRGYTKIVTKPHVQAGDPGTVLTLQITNVSGVDRALYDSRALTVNGIIYQDGKEVTSFMARRRTSRRALHISWNCKMFDNSIGEIEEDLERWFAKPVPGARLGDL